MAGLLGELSGEFGPGRTSRPYRDLRFRADKSPYKTEIYATLDRGRDVRFSADGLTAGLGYFMIILPSWSGTATRFTEKPEAPGWPGWWWSGCGQRDSKSVAGRPSTSAPRGYPTGHPRIELLRYKGLICWRHWPVAPWPCIRRRPRITWWASCASRRRCSTGWIRRSDPIRPDDPARAGQPGPWTYPQHILTIPRPWPGATERRGRSRAPSVTRMAATLACRLRLPRMHMGCRCPVRLDARYLLGERQ